jgi:CelD/BcsL family acetyltransferase involved in cellulose biosynthesis
LKTAKIKKRKRKKKRKKEREEIANRDLNLLPNNVKNKNNNV